MTAVMTRRGGDRHHEEAALVEEWCLAFERVPRPQQNATADDTQCEPGQLTRPTPGPLGIEHPPLPTTAPSHRPEERTHEKRLGSRVGPVVEAVGGDPDVVQRGHQRRRCHGTGTGDEHQGSSSPKTEDQQRHQGPDEVVLLLHGQRPSVKQRGRCS